MYMLSCMGKTEDRTNFERMFSQLSSQMNLHQLHITDYVSALDGGSTLYVNESIVDYNAGDYTEGQILEGSEQIPVSVEILEEEELEDKRAVDDGAFLESVLEDGNHNESLYKETVTVTMYPEKIVNPEESVGGTPEFMKDLDY